VAAPRTPGQRAGLTRSQVLAGARELLAERGPEALTMRALAERLGVSPNALYSHVEDKAALVDELLDDALAEVEAPSPEAGDPIAGVHALMASTYRVLLAHVELVALYLARQGARGPNAERLGEITLALLARAGVAGGRAREALHVLIVYTIGAAAFVARPPLAGAHAAEPLATDHEARFERGLEWILAGIDERARRPSTG
jgi:TetR/AcrR family transcriptional regulator, tetracycline repressor protein